MIMRKEKNSTNRADRKITGAVIAFVVILAVFAAITAFDIYYEYLQFAEIGMKYIYVFYTTVTVKIAAQAASFVIVFLFFLLNNIVMRKILFKDNSDLRVVRSPVWLAVITTVIALFASSIISSSIYHDFLTFSGNVKFNRTDPIFNLDLSYYIFERPFYISVVNSIKGILMMNFIYTLIVYVLLQLRDGISEIGKTFENHGVLIHCVVNAMLFISAVAMSYKFAAEDMLFGNFCEVTGASFADVNIWLLYYKITPFLLLLIAPLVVYFLRKGKYSKAVISVLIFPAVWVAAFAAAAVCQSVIVDSDELAMESEYLQYNVDMTREAYNLDTIQEKNFDVDNNLTYKNIADEHTKISAVSAVDMEQYTAAINKLQGLGTYYKFFDSDLVPYEIDGVKTFAAVSARELDGDRIEKSADTYVNKTFKYTHGTGVSVGDVRSGVEQFIVKDIPVLSNFGFTNIKQPRIYYGEKMNNSVVVNTRYNEVDYMNAENSAYSYEGFGGIQMTMLNRIVLSFCEKNYQMLVSNQITSQSRALINRNVVERVKKIAPFFSYDSDPYMIVTDNGELKWILDVYTVTSQYPYSTPINGSINYIRCPAKAVVDAYNGSVSFYITDPDDVFVKTYQKIYPTLFEYGEMPETIASHIRYPKDMFKIQAEAYRRYHVTDAAQFYDKNDVWDFAKEKDKTGAAQYVECYYSTDGSESFLNILYTSQHTDNINGWLTAGSDMDNYGQLTVAKINKAEGIICSTMYAENIIDANENISEQLENFSQNGANVLVGNMQVMSVKNSLLYITPVYVENTANSAAYPELKKVIAVYNNDAAMGDNLTEALQILFGKKSADTVVMNGEEHSLNKLINDIIDVYDSIKQYNRANDWENAGKAMSELDLNMEELKQRRAELEDIEPFVGPLENTEED